MAKKSTTKNNSMRHHQPNAPELQQILHQTSTQQPPLNPYYPDIGSVSPAAHSHQPPPPPYSSYSTRGPVSTAIYHSVPMSQLNNDDVSYPRLNQAHRPVIIQAPGVPYDHQADRYKRRVRAFNSNTIIMTVFAVLMTLWAYSMYADRNCVDRFVVHKPDKDLEITIAMVRMLHLNLVYGGLFLLCLCTVRGCFGFNGKHFGCYLFIVSMVTFVLTALTAYAVWLAFYSPCTGSFEKLVSGFSKTILSKITDSLPGPDKNYFGESNVIAQAKEDPSGLMIFILDVGSLIFYLSIWLGSVSAC